ncbi:MAG: HhH-GPD-type base excision DNA repair protein [Beutenbergiaceae bacterium]
MVLHLTGDPAADRLLSDNPLALLIGMLLDQQVAMEVAFEGPAKLAQRLSAFDAATMADLDAEEFAGICAQTPAVHRYPKAMAGRIQALCATVVADYDGDAAAIWRRGEPDGATVLRRLQALPGFGVQKSKIFLALLGKQTGLSAPGWAQAAGDYGKPGTFRSIADVTDPASLARVREFKKAAKAAARK